MSEECLKNAQDLTKSQKHDPLTHSPIWIQEMLAHLKPFFLINGKKNICLMRPPCWVKVNMAKIFSKGEAAFPKIAAVRVDDVHKLGIAPKHH